VVIGLREAANTRRCKGEACDAGRDAAPQTSAAVPWALVITRAAAVTVANLPLTLFFLMGTRYFDALPFRFAACVAALLLLLAAFWPTTTTGTPPRSGLHR
jgi:hypothetical protein